MKKPKLVATALAVLLAVSSSTLLFGCSSQGSRDVELTPTVSDSNLVSAGTLTVGVDSTLAPFGGISNGEIVGVDVDIAAALASQLGLSLEIVDTSGSDAITMLEDGTIDIAMSISSTRASNSSVSLIGPYLDNSSALFTLDSNATSSVTSTSLANATVGAYSNSNAARAVTEYSGAQNLETFTSLSDAFEALESGSVDYVASDVVAGGYLSMSYDSISYVMSLESSTSSEVYIAILDSNATLASSILSALQEIYENGVLEIVAAKWVGTECAMYTIPTQTISIISPDDTDTTTTEDESDTDEEATTDS